MCSHAIAVMGIHYRSPSTVTEANFEPADCDRANMNQCSGIGRERDAPNTGNLVLGETKWTVDEFDDGRWYIMTATSPRGAVFGAFQRRRVGAVSNADRGAV